MRDLEARLLVATAVNDAAVLANCLARSPDIRTGRLPLRTYADRASAALAYNEAIDTAPADAVIVFAHQDVYLPAGWTDTLVAALAGLSATDRDWAVAGLVGKTDANAFVGRVWSTGMAMLLVGTRPLPCRVGCLDELLLVVDVASGLRFDPALPGFHLYGVDIVQQARHAGRGAWAIDAPVIHHDKPIPRLDPGYRAAWRHVHARWRTALPIPTLIVPLDNRPLRLVTGDLRLRRGRGRGCERTAPTSDPHVIAALLGWEEKR